jgi:hypothetical protein
MLDQIESRAGRVQCREDDCGGGLVGAQKDHQDVDERLSLFDLQTRFPIRARTNVRRSAAAASTSKSGFGGSLLTNMAMHPQIQAYASFDRNMSAKGWAGALVKHCIKQNRKNVAFLLRFCCGSLVFDDFLSQAPILGIPFQQA